MDLLKVAVLGYKVPILTYLSSTAEAGDLVLVPVRGRIAYGIVVGIGSECGKLKRIREVVVKQFISANLLELVRWMSDYYLTSVGEVIRTVIPRFVIQSNKKSEMQVCEEIAGPRLNRWQNNAVCEIAYSLKNRIHNVFLLYGITGSGKTEIYIKLIQMALRMGRGAILLYPEIVLTPLYQARFKNRFPAAILHSNLSTKDRRHNWHALRQGLVSAAVGPRSAVFAPLNDVGLIIIDEEHSPSYKEEFRSPRFHAREVAIARGYIENCPVILGSATPSVDTYHKAVVGEYRLIRLPKRIKKRPMPEVRVVDLRREKERIFTNQLLIELRKTVRNRNQAIIFINRKGYAPVVFCKNCGYSSYCSDCGIPLVFYQRGRILRCPYCGHMEPMIKRCPRCHSDNLQGLGSGTERIEERLSKIFGYEKVLRADRDQIRRELFRLYTQFQNRDRLLMVGTSLVTKGHDFPFVTLVGVINGDQILNLPDFRAGEFTFQTLTQVAGRAGRGDIGGLVIIQTYRPDHLVFKAIRDHKYEVFYNNEIVVRKELDYPPFARIILLRFSGPDLKSLIRAGEKVKLEIPSRKDMTVFGPAQAFRRKVGKNYNVILLIKIKGDHRWLKEFLEFKFKGIKVAVDVDPMSVS